MADKIKTVFLSASIPAPQREQKYLKNTDSNTIMKAIEALAKEALAHGQLVFGGHPLISPIILGIAKRMDALSKVGIFQSELFRQHIPVESQQFPQLFWTRNVAGSRDASLLLMREIMASLPGHEKRDLIPEGLKDDFLDSVEYTAGVFIGGMEGVEEEARIFMEKNPDTPVFFMGSTGGAARILLENSPDLYEESFQNTLRESTNYSELFKDIVWD